MTISRSELLQENMPIIWHYLKVGHIDTIKDVTLDDILYVEFTCSAIIIRFMDSIVNTNTKVTLDNGEEKLLRNDFAVIHFFEFAY